jgi:HPt (histidine-containing phosphotransfer) domain-containing protein
LLSCIKANTGHVRNSVRNILNIPRLLPKSPVTLAQPPMLAAGAGRRPEGDASMNFQVVDTHCVLDLAGAMQQLDGDAELLQEIVEIFVETGPDQLTALAAAIKVGDADQTALVSHGMKGGASNFCADRLVETARELEALAKTGRLEGAASVLGRLEADFAELAEVASVVNWDEVRRNWQG